MYLSSKVYFSLVVFTLSLFSYGDALQCISCNSEKNVNCSVRPHLVDNKENWEECSPETESCFTAIFKNNHTYRGCKTESLELDKPFDLCKIDKCNNKIYPTYRQKCYNCAGEECVKPNENIESIPCVKYQERRSYCATHIANKTYGIRGCLEEVEPLIPSDLIETCYKDNCNNEPGIKEVNCVQCDSKASNNCDQGNPILSKGKCKEILFRGLNKTDEACFFYKDLDRVIRDCHSNVSAYGYEIDRGIFYKCSTHDFCNGYSVPNYECFVCGENTDDPDCTQKLTKMTSGKELACFACFEQKSYWEKKVIKRGAGFFPSELSGQCYNCEGEKCNEGEPIVCNYCSSKTDINCAGVIDRNLNITKICPTVENRQEHCITAIDNDGYTIRSCRPPKAVEKSYKDIAYCRNNYPCNSEILPKNRTQCYTCNGINNPEECNILPDNHISKGCQKINSNNQCYEALIGSSTNIVRGCTEDENYKHCLENKKQCHTYLGSNGNNKTVTMKPAKHHCYFCDNKDKNCQWTQHTSYNATIVACKGLVPINEIEKCYSYKSDDGKTQRGCSFEDGKCTKNSEEGCSTCSKHGCNDEVLIKQECVQEVYPTSENKKDLKKQECTYNVQYPDWQGCYVYKNGSYINWGCKCYMSKEQLAFCEIETNKCTICTGDECDKMKVPGSSNAIIGSTFMLLSSLFLVFKF